MDSADRTAKHLNLAIDLTSQQQQQRALIKQCIQEQYRTMCTKRPRKKD